MTQSKLKYYDMRNSDTFILFTESGHQVPITLYYILTTIFDTAMPHGREIYLSHIGPLRSN